MPDTRRQTGQHQLGATPLDDGLVEFRVWAPRARAVAVEVPTGRHDLEEAGDGFWAG